MAKVPERHFRYYFVVRMPCLIPETPYVKGRRSRTRTSDTGFLDNVAREIASALPGDGFDVAHRSHRPVPGVPRLYDVEFVVAKIDSMKGSLAACKGRIRTEIEDALRREYVLQSVTFEYAASRNFVWEVYLGGALDIRHTITDQDVADLGGGVAWAIEVFYEKVADQLGSMYDVHTMPPSRRPRSGIYTFELTATRCFCFEEADVIGNVAALVKDSDSPGNYELGLDCSDDALTRVCDDERDVLQSNHIDMLDAEFEVVHFSFDFVDYNEDLMEIIDA